MSTKINSVEKINKSPDPPVINGKERFWGYGIMQGKRGSVSLPDILLQMKCKLETLKRFRKKRLNF